MTFSDCCVPPAARNGARSDLAPIYGCIKISLVSFSARGAHTCQMKISPPCEITNLQCIEEGEAMVSSTENDCQSHLLLVEDSPHHVRLMREALKDVNPSLHLHVADDGVEAMAFLRHEGIKADAPRPDLVLLDLNLPRMDGREVLAQIKRDDDLKTIPTIILTTSVFDGDVSTSYQLHANAYLKKPLGWDAFVQMVMNLNNFWLAQSQSQLALPNRNRSSTWD
jgi:two-component system, chemotaxis family, response regulator Rcp1